MHDFFSSYVVALFTMGQKNHLMLWHKFLPARVIWRLILAYLHASWYWFVHAKSALNLPREVPSTAHEWRRFKHYFMGVTYLSEVFSALNGHRPSRAERQQLITLSALAVMFDDQAEIKHTSQTAFGNHVSFGVSIPPNGLGIQLLNNLYQQLPSERFAPFVKYLKGVFRAEMAVKTVDGNPQPEQERSSTAEKKGGYSVLLFRTLLLPAPSQLEIAALYEFGGLLQLTDDIFDVWEDQAAGVHTLPNTLIGTGKLEGLAEIYDAEVKRVQKAFARLPVPVSQMQLALGLLQALVGLNSACLAHYAALQSKYGKIPMDNRKLVIMDMSSWRNRWRALCHFYKISREATSS